MLAELQVVVDVTMQENCWLCGASEALAFNKPLVTSKTMALPNYFLARGICAPRARSDC